MSEPVCSRCGIDLSKGECDGYHLCTPCRGYYYPELDAQLAELQKPCVWKHCSSNEGDVTTSCKGTLMFLSKPTFDYCPYCGHPVEHREGSDE